MNIDFSGPRSRNLSVLKPILNDRCIRQALIHNLVKQEHKPRAVIEELRVHNGNAIADVVALFDEAHCYEIKGATDKIERITIQSIYYNTAFRRITLVTTEGNLARALKIVPAFWGILLACNSSTEITFRWLRKPKQNPKFSKELAVLTLWKSEMLELLPQEERRRQPRTVLAQLISAATKKAELSSHICESLLGRYLTQGDQMIPPSTM